jgi:hypothetical protein
MGGVFKAAGNTVGNLLGGIGAYNGAKEEGRYADRAMDLQWEMYQKQMDLAKPFYEAGIGGLQSLQGIAGKPLNREAELAQYYSSPEFSMQSQQARGQQLAASEAMGGLGSTSTGNAIAAIAPQLGQGYLGQRQAQQADLFNQLMGMTNIGLQGMGAQSAAAGQHGSQGAQMQLYRGNLAGGKKALPWQVTGQTFKDAGNTVGNMFSPSSWLGMDSGSGNGGGGMF